MIYTFFQIVFTVDVPLSACKTTIDVSDNNYFKAKVTEV